MPPVEIRRYVLKNGRITDMRQYSGHTLPASDKETTVDLPSGVHLVHQADGLGGPGSEGRLEVYNAHNGRRVRSLADQQSASFITAERPRQNEMDLLVVIHGKASPEIQHPIKLVEENRRRTR
jgi:hypothetical protein